MKGVDCLLVIAARQVDVAGVQVRGRGDPGFSGSDDGNRLVRFDRVVKAAFLLRDLCDPGQALRLFRDVGSLRTGRKRQKHDERGQDAQGRQSQEIWVLVGQNVSRALARITK